MLNFKEIAARAAIEERRRIDAEETRLKEELKQSSAARRTADSEINRIFRSTVEYLQENANYQDVLAFRSSPPARDGNIAYECVEVGWGLDVLFMTQDCRITFNAHLLRNAQTRFSYEIRDIAQFTSQRVDSVYYAPDSRRPWGALADLDTQVINPQKEFLTTKRFVFDDQGNPYVAFNRLTVSDCWETEAVPLEEWLARLAGKRSAV